MSFECLNDRVLCPMDERCPACTTARLRDRERLLDRELSELRWQSQALVWALDQIVRHVLSTDGSDLRIARFASAVNASRTCTPELLSHLEAK